MDSVEHSAGNEHPSSISRWRGEFLSAVLEARYRHHVQGETARQMRSSLLVAAGLFLAFSVSDYALLGIGDAFFALLALRAVVVAAALTLAGALVRWPSVVNSPLAVNAVVFIGVTGIILIVPLRPETVNTQIPAVMVATIAVYLYFPNRVPWMVAMNGYLGIGFLLAVAWLAPVPAGVLVTLSLLLLFVNTVGLMTAMRLSVLRRSQYASLLEERQINQRLQEEIAERRRLETQLKEMARTDELTGVHTRRRFFELAAQEMRRIRREHTPLAVCMLDLDGFKEVNDTHGHAVGDRVLRGVARRCREALRESDIIGRFGGEEFTVMLPGTDLEGACALAERLREHVATMEISAVPTAIRPTVTVGVATVNEDDPSVDAALQRADRALYRGKAEGRNRVVPGTEDATRGGASQAVLS